MGETRRCGDEVEVERRDFPTGKDWRWYKKGWQGWCWYMQGWRWYAKDWLRAVLWLALSIVSFFVFRYAHCKVLAGYSLSVGIGAFVLYCAVAVVAQHFVDSLRKRQHWDGPARFISTTFFVGVFERFMYTTAFMSYMPEFVGVWLVFKAVSNWTRWQSERDLFNKYLIGNALSLIMAYWGASVALGEFPIKTRSELASVQRSDVRVGLSVSIPEGMTFGGERCTTATGPAMSGQIAPCSVATRCPMLRPTCGKQPVHTYYSRP
jgi:hypothetical protein